MTSTTETNDIKTLFAAMAIDDVPPSDAMPAIDEVVAAILDKEHTLNAEQLLAFENLLDDPQASAEERQELLQAIWNVVVCFMDYKWEQAQRSAGANTNACGSNTRTNDQITQKRGDLLEWSQSEFEGEDSETAAQGKRRKGSNND